jgi:hypothetical protein
MIWARHGRQEGTYGVLVGIPERKRPLGRPRHRWGNIIKMDLHSVYKEVWTCGNTPQACLWPLSGPQLSNHTSLLMALLGAPTRETNSAGHAYRICQLTKGRVGWPAEIRIKEGRPSCGHSLNARTRSKQLGHIKKEETMPGCPAMMPRGPGTTSLIMAHFPAALCPVNTASRLPSSIPLCFTADSLTTEHWDECNWPCL